MPRARLAAALSAAALVAVALVSPGSASASTHRIYWGAVNTSASVLSKEMGVPSSNHAYALLGNKVPYARMISMRDPNHTWKQVAAAGPGTGIYNNLVRWANTLKARSGPIFLAYHHEPEASGSYKYGSATSFIAAFRHVENVIKSHGATNVRFVWQMTSYAFRVKSSDRRYAPKWYPGDKYVNDVAADGYNWYKWPPGTGQWVELSSYMQPVLNFAKAHGKHMILAEYGCYKSTRRADWMSNVGKWVISNAAWIDGAYYFQSTQDGNAWPLTTYTGLTVYQKLARNTTYFRS